MLELCSGHLSEQTKQKNKCNTNSKLQVVPDTIKVETLKCLLGLEKKNDYENEFFHISVLWKESNQLNQENYDCQFNVTQNEGYAKVKTQYVSRLGEEPEKLRSKWAH